MGFINPNLLPIKTHYFLFNAGQAPIVPFMSTYIKQLGLSSVIVGLIFTLLPIIAMIGKPLMCAIADRFKCQKLVFRTCILVTIVTYMAVMFIPSIPFQANVEVQCSEESFVRICTDKITGNDCIVSDIQSGGNTTMNVVLWCDGNSTFLESACHMWHMNNFCPVNGSSGVYNYTYNVKLQPFFTKMENNCLFIKIKSIQFNDNIEWHEPRCNGSLLLSSCKMQYSSEALSKVIDAPDVDLVTKYQFWLLTSMLVLSWVGMSVVVAIGDAICFSVLGNNPNRYGQQRLWGAIGWGLFSTITGYLVDAFSQGRSAKNYNIMFYLMAILLSLNILVSFKLKYTSNEQTPRILSDMKKLFSDIRIVVFMFWCVSVGMCTAFIWNFLFWFLEDLVSSCDSNDWIKTLEGLVVGIQCFGGELPFFFLSGWILKKLGHVNVMTLVLFGFAARFLLYSVLKDPWWCLPIEVLQGITQSLNYATMASYASLVAPAGMENTVQGLVGAAFEGFGVSLGSFIAGILFSRMSGSMVFRVSGLVALLVCILHVCIQLLLKLKPTVCTRTPKDQSQKEMELLD